MYVVYHVFRVWSLCLSSYNTNKRFKSVMYTIRYSLLEHTRFLNRKYSVVSQHNTYNKTSTVLCRHVQYLLCSRFNPIYCFLYSFFTTPTDSSETLLIYQIVYFIFASLVVYGYETGTPLTIKYSST